MRAAILILAGALFVSAPTWAQEEGTPPGAAPVAPVPAAARRPASDVAERRRAASEARLRALIASFGYENHHTQDAIIEYINAEEEARRPQRELARRLVVALRRGTPPERLNELLAQYKESQSADRARRQSAQAALDARVGFSVDPRLEALLWISGILGESGSSLLGQLLPSPPPPPRREEGRREEGRHSISALATTATGAATPVGAAVAAPTGAYPTTLRRGVVIGTLLARGDVRGGELWVEIGSERGERERYFAAWNPDNGFDMALLDVMADTPLGARVRGEWQGDERKTLVSLARAQAETPPALTVGGAANPEEANAPGEVE